MARSKTMARRPSSSQATEPSNALSHPSASKGKQQATKEEPRDPQNLNLSPFLVLREGFVSLSNHLISSSQQERELTVQNENAFRKSRDQVAILLKYADNIHKDETIATNQEEPLDTENEGSDA
ncbi:hypothetical protein AHAS_Ahas19G0314300 [Arachis hypogaea]